MFKRLFGMFVLSAMPFIAFANAAADGEAVAQVNYLKAIAIAIRDFIFIIMFIAGIIIFFIAIIMLVKDYIMGDDQRGDKKFKVGELGLGILLAGALMSPYGLLQVGADAAGGGVDPSDINQEVFTQADESQGTGN